MAGRRRTVLVTTLSVLAVVVGVSVVAVHSIGSSRPKSRATAPLPPTTVATPLSPPTTLATIADPAGSRLRFGTARSVRSPALVADAVGPRVPLYNQPGDGEPADVVDNPTFEGLDVVFLVMEQRTDWLEVQVSRRPNEATVWVRAADVSLRTTPYRIVVDSTAHRLTLTDAGTTVLDVPVAVGTGGTPTPTGTFFVDGAVRLADPTGPYGAYQVSVSAFSDVLTSFGGGNGQIAIHGTNAPGLVGTAVSHGCVRMTNADVTRVATMVPVGTPVEIVG